MTDMRRVTLVIPNSLDEKILELKKDAQIGRAPVCTPVT